MKKSMIETAYEVLAKQGKPMSFLELWEIVAKEMGFNQRQHDDNIAQFYSDLSLDGRFASLPKNTWDLRKRQSHATTIIDTDSLSVEDEEDEPVFDEADEETTEEASGDEDDKEDEE